MKLDFFPQGAAGRSAAIGTLWSETDRLTDVLLCRPDYLEAVPCCSVTKEAVRDGFEASVPTALRQHRALQRVLERNGVRCHFVAPVPEMPDLCFTRDALLTTPWGVMPLKPAAEHRRAEADHALNGLRALGVAIAPALTAGTVEGGDVAIVRPGLVVIGCSGERTDAAGAESLALMFRRRGWKALIHRFDPHFLHLDTQFAMVGEGLALACVDVLSSAFLEDLDDRGIDIVPVSYKESRRLGCNVLALGGKRVIASAGQDRIAAELTARGYVVDSVDLDQFTRCGGGVHCLTMPLARVRRA